MTLQLIWIVQNFPTIIQLKEKVALLFLFSCPCAFARPDSTSYWNALVHGRKRWMFLTHEDSDHLRPGSLQFEVVVIRCQLASWRISTHLDAWLTGLWGARLTGRSGDFKRSDAGLWWCAKFGWFAAALGFCKKPASFPHDLMWS